MSILGPDATPGTEEFDLYIKEVTREMTSKAGQKCTAIRRVIAPAEIAGDVVKALSTALGEIRMAILPPLPHIKKPVPVGLAFFCLNIITDPNRQHVSRS